MSHNIPAGLLYDENSGLSSQDANKSDTSMVGYIYWLEYGGHACPAHGNIILCKQLHCKSAVKTPPSSKKPSTLNPNPSPEDVTDLAVVCNASQPRRPSPGAAAQSVVQDGPMRLILLLWHLPARLLAHQFHQSLHLLRGVLHPIFIAVVKP